MQLELFHISFTVKDTELKEFYPDFFVLHQNKVVHNIKLNNSDMYMYSVPFTLIPLNKILCNQLCSDFS